MNKIKLPKFVNSRLGFFGLLTILLWVKNIAAYLTEFKLGVESFQQYLILFINPIATTIFMLSIALYVKGKKSSYITMLVIYSLMTLLLFSNIVYYREFTDFITINTMLGAGQVSSGLGETAIPTISYIGLISSLWWYCLLAKKSPWMNVPCAHGWL